MVLELYDKSIKVREKKNRKGKRKKNRKKKSKKKNRKIIEKLKKIIILFWNFREGSFWEWWNNL